jgi:hypothetical protein
VARPTRSRPLLVGGGRWSVELGRTLAAHGVSVVMWAGSVAERERIRDAGLELAPDRLLADATGRGEELEGITSVLFLTGENDFNALAVAQLRGSVEEGVFRVAGPRRDEEVVAPYATDEVLFSDRLTGTDIAHRYDDGARFLALPRTSSTVDGLPVLFVIRSDGRLEPATAATMPQPHPDDLLILLGRASGAAAQ